MENPILFRIDKRRKELRLSREETSRRAGFSADLLRNLARNPSQQPSAKALYGLAKALNVSPDWLLTGEGAMEMVKHTPQETAPAAQPRDLPVLGTVGAAIIGAFQITGEIVDYVRRPPALSGVPGAYALYVSGESMAPAFEDGQTIHVHPQRPCRAGDYVVLQEQYQNDETIASIKRLVRRTAEKIICKQYNPPAEIEYNRRSVKVIHRVLVGAELLG